MTVHLLCFKCSTAPALFGHQQAEPTHCYGTGDQPGTPGLIGSGTFCPCECRGWAHQPHALYAKAASEHPDDREAMLARYRELMIEHGHLIPGTPKNLPCGWPGNSSPAASSGASAGSPSGTGVEGGSNG